METSGSTSAAGNAQPATAGAVTAKMELDTPDCGVEMRSKRKVLSMPGFTKKHKSATPSAEPSASRAAKTLSMPGGKKARAEGKKKHLPSPTRVFTSVFKL